MKFGLACDPVVSLKKFVIFNKCIYDQVIRSKNGGVMHFQDFGQQIDSIPHNNRRKIRLLWELY
jgi:hypothetical protein